MGFMLRKTNNYEPLKRISHLEMNGVKLKGRPKLTHIETYGEERNQ